MEKTVLSNGLRIVYEKIPGARSVSFGIWVKNGSRNETLKNNGISHFIEHMLFKGTPRRSAAEIAEIFDRLGGNVNAFTAKEYTCYYAKVLDEHLPIAVDVLADMFFHSEFAESEIEKEKNVIIEEISMYEDTPDDLVHDLAAKAAYGAHPLGFSILGSAENLHAFRPEDLFSYMRNTYTVDNTVISMAGNVDKETLQLMNRHFGDFMRRGTSEHTVSPEYRGDYIAYAKKTEQNHLCLSLPGCSADDPLLYAMILLNNAVGGGMSSRLFQEIREKRGLAYSIYSYHSSFVDSGLFTIYAGTAPRQTEEVLKLVLAVMDEIRAHGLTEKELAQGKEQMKGSLILGLESASSRMNRLGKNELLLGEHMTLDELITKIQGVTMDDIRQLIDRLFADPYSASIVGETGAAAEKWRRLICRT
ncbi:MAG TPA: pitrilysin family protein [Bacilli bacterium]